MDMFPWDCLRMVALAQLLNHGRLEQGTVKTREKEPRFLEPVS